MRGVSLGLIPLAGLVVALAACGGSNKGPVSAPPKAPAKPSPQQFLVAHKAARSVDLTLIAGDGASNNGFNFDDYGRGEMTVSVPKGWKVVVHCKNSGGGLNSCSVVSGPDASALAFPGASTPKPATGLAPGESATFSFVASRVGTYRLTSLVYGKELARMYDVLQVTPGGQPAISARPGP